MKILTFDLETENHTLNKRKASPFDKRNYIVQIGWSINGGPAQEKYYDEWHRDPVLPCLDDIDVLVGFNIKFDLLWVWREPELEKFLERGGTIYCGQYAEYLLGGATQDVHMCAMNDIAEVYGGGCKIDAVKEMWEDGVLTSEIPRDLLTDYLIGDGAEIVGDVMNTWKIYCGQVARMKAEMAPEFIKMFKHRMDGLLATIEMEYNGVFVDTELGEELREDLIVEIEKARIELEKFIPELPPELTFNWRSNTHKSCLIFGGTVSYKKWLAHTDDNGNIIYAKKKEKWPLFAGVAIPPSECIEAGAFYVMEVPEGTAGSFERNGKHWTLQDRYKGGKQKGYGKTKNVDVPDETKPKGAKQDHYFTFKGHIRPERKWLLESTDAYDAPMYQTGSEIIEELGKRGLPFTDALVKHTAMTKDLGTYYWTENKDGKRKGMLTLVGEDGILHHKLNCVNTVTTRMSSSDPNLQNIPRGDKSLVKSMFKSRFENGKTVEIDYSQLEVVIQGVLTGDSQLCQDLRDRVDFHCKRLSAKLGESYEDVLRKCKVDEDPDYCRMRTEAKVFSFQRAYGAGAKTISDSTGLPESEVMALIHAEETLYPGVKIFDERLERHINANRKRTNKKIFHEGVAFTQGQASWNSPTGTRYTWEEQIAPEFMHRKGKFTSFSPTERKNYPIQGMGGEVVQTMLGKVFRYFIANKRFNGKLLMVNTVHDCAWFDGEEKLMLEQAPKIQKIMESVPDVFNKAFNMNISVPFPAETEIGNDMYDMEVLHG
jgi:DNA polymerase I-like protein with 3'-5' exonuclease and polymerase domains